MTTNNAYVPMLLPVDPLSRAVACYLARFKGESRVHCESDLRIFVRWCLKRDLDPLSAQRPHIELYARWIQEVRGFKLNTVSRRFSVVCCFYRTCVIDGILERSPADNVHRPPVPQESPTLGLSHLQFEAMLATSRLSANVNDFALVAMLGLLGLRIFEATGLNIEDISEVHGHRVLRMHGKGDKIVLVPMPRGSPSDRTSHRRPRHRSDLADENRDADGPGLCESTAPGDRSGEPRADRADASPHAAPHLRYDHARRRLEHGDVQIAARHADPRTTMRYDRARRNLDRHPN